MTAPVATHHGSKYNLLDPSLALSSLINQRPRHNPTTAHIARITKNSTRREPVPENGSIVCG